MPRRKKSSDVPGQMMLEEQPQVHLHVPAGAVVTVEMPASASSNCDKPLTPARLSAGFLRSMKLPQADFHAALMQASQEGLDLVAFSKRVHGALYHAFHKSIKLNRRAA